MKQQIIIFIVLLLTVSVMSFVVNLTINRLAKSTNSDNTQSSYLIVKAVLFLLIGYIFSGLVMPLMTLNRISETSSDNIITTSSKYYVAFIFIAITISLLTYAIAYLLFNVFYSKSKLSFALANNDISAAVLFVGLVFLTAFLGKEILPHLIDVIIPYPQIPIYR